MIKRRTLIAVGALAAVGLGLSGCASGGSGQSDGKQTVSLLVPT